MSTIDPNFVEMIVEQVTQKVTETLTEKLQETISGNLNIDLYHHVDVKINIDSPIPVIQIQQLPPPGPTRAVIILKGSKLPGQITVDTTNETATLQFVDRVGEPTATPDGAVISWSTDGPGVATAAVAGDDQTVAAISPTGAGDCNVLADVSGATEPDGSPFPQASVPIHVDPGAAVGDRISLSV